MLCRGEVPIREPELEKLIADGRGRNRLHFISDLAAAVTGADIVYSAVWHPTRASSACNVLSVIDLRSPRTFLRK
jgi:UDPglucose 6-dehydrogenase